MPERPSYPTPGRETPTQASPLPDEALDFYHVPGHGPVDEKAVRRYQRRRDALQAPFADQTADRPPTHSFHEPVPSSSGTNAQDLAESLLSIDWTPLEDRAPLVREALTTQRSGIQLLALHSIPKTDEGSRHALIRLAVSQIRDGLRRGSFPEDYAAMIDIVPSIYRPALIQFGLDCEPSKTRVACARLVSDLPKTEQSFFRDQIERKVTSGLRSFDLEERVGAAKLIPYAGTASQERLVEIGLSSDVLPVQYECAQHLRFLRLKEDTRQRLSRYVTQAALKALDGRSPADQRLAVGIIQYAPQQDTGLLIERSLQALDPETRRLGITKLAYVSFDEQARLLTLALQANDPETASICVKHIKNTSPQLLAQSPVLADILYARHGRLLVEPRLYRKTTMGDTGPATRAPLPKTGHETTLLGGPLKNKVIIRRLEERSFRAWQKLYESQEYWRQEGFDYVPIEPIASFRRNKNGLIEVASGVLDLTLAEWAQLGGRFVRELVADRDRIVDAVERAGVRHQDPSDSNLCLRFFRDQDGNIDFTRKPRLYLIDFDHVY